MPSYRKYKGKANVIGEVIKEKREKLGLTKADVCRKMELFGVSIDRTELYRIEEGQRSVKDFEIIVLFEVLQIDYNSEIKPLIIE